MSAIIIAQKTMKDEAPQMIKDLLEVLATKYEGLPTPEEILEQPEVKEIMKPTRKKSKKKTTPLEERLGKYGATLCDARIWKEKPGSGGLGYDNIQCSSKKKEGCFCMKHFKMQQVGKLWTGLITEERPEEPKKPDGCPMAWSTDIDGNDIVKEKKRKKKEPKKRIEDFSEEDLEILLEKRKKGREKIVSQKEGEGTEEEVDEAEVWKNKPTFLMGF